MKPSELVKWREINKCSQVDLAKALGVAANTVYRWEKGMREIPSFLHIALKCLKVKKGGRIIRDKKSKKEREVTK